MPTFSFTSHTTCNPCSKVAAILVCSSQVTYIQSQVKRSTRPLLPQISKYLIGFSINQPYFCYFAEVTFSTKILLLTYIRIHIHLQKYIFRPHYLRLWKHFLFIASTLKCTEQIWVVLNVGWITCDTTKQKEKSWLLLVLQNGRHHLVAGKL